MTPPATEGRGPGGADRDDRTGAGSEAPAPRVLLVEDDPNLAYSLAFNLRAEGHEVTHAENRAEAEARLAAGPAPDLVILDVMLPDGSGLDICRAMRERGDATPILFLTARGGPDSVVSGLEAGGDDYLAKPFHLQELLGRVGALLRRRAWGRPEPRATRLTFGPHAVDFETGEVLAAGRPITLTDLELRLLRYFADHERRIIPRSELLERVWEVSPRARTRVVDNFVMRLRRVFEEDPRRPRHFLTVRGAGYRFVR